MTNKSIAKVERLMREFLALAKQRRRAIRGSVYESHGTICHSDCPRESGALRRKSMDVTRALAEMRRPR